MNRAVLSAAVLLCSCATVPGAKPPSKKKAAAEAAVAVPAPAAPLRTWTQTKPVVIRHATVMPASSPAIPDGAISFADGKIVAVGKNADVPTPPGAEELDGTGLYVTPGVIDVHSHLGVYASPASFANADGNEMTAPVTAEVSAEHSFWPQDPGLRRAAAGGVTSLLVLPGSANLIGGRGFPVKLHFGRSAARDALPGREGRAQDRLRREPAPGLRRGAEERARDADGERRRLPEGVPRGEGLRGEARGVDEEGGEEPRRGRPAAAARPQARDARRGARAARSSSRTTATAPTRWR